MSEKRTYGDSCGIARALDLAGERWALLIVRELLLGPKRFTDLRAGLPNVGPDMLSLRLRELERAGVVARRRLPPPAGAAVYELTEWGQELQPVLVALGRWGSRAALPQQPPPLSPDALVVALESMFDPAAAGGGPETYALTLGEHRFALLRDGDRLHARRVDGAPREAPLAIDTDPGTLAGVLWHGLPVDDAIAAGTLSVAGPRRALDRFLALFAQPVPAPTPAAV
jgi:DNA-binding HxlR family transcriptional regulator